MNATRIRHGESTNNGSSLPDYELWLRMASDNKINAKNSWNFGLIDYLYDLSKQPTVNFQKASAVLDGCIKIYSSRVDSVATETGSLLSGLTNHTELKSTDQEETEGPDRASNLRKRNTRLESTLVNSFEDIRVKNIEKELVVDPVFKQTISYFDEGGAKSLLLNNLTTDKTGRVLFDSDSNSDYIKSEELISAEAFTNIKSMLFGTTSLQNLKVCDSIKALKQYITDQEEISQPVIPENFDLDNELNDDYEEFNDNESFHEDEEENMQVERIPDYELMAYFDNTIKEGYSKFTSWKVKRYSNNKKKSVKSLNEQKQPKEQVEYFKPFSYQEETEFEDMIFSKSVAKISIPVLHQHDGRFYNNYCLSPDQNISSKRLIQLFTKNSKPLSTFDKQIPRQPEPEIEDGPDYDIQFDEPSRLMFEATREDIQELNQSHIEDFSQPLSQIPTDLGRLNYEKISKRIDIRSIKESMHSKMQDQVSFKQLIQEIPKNFNGSTSVYFICLLHLCNECNLDLQKVGDDLLVYKITQ